MAILLSILLVAWIFVFMWCLFGANHYDEKPKERAKDDGEK